MKFATEVDEVAYDCSLDESYVVMGPVGDTRRCESTVLVDVDDVTGGLPGSYAIVRECAFGFIDVEWYRSRIAAMQEWHDVVEPFHAEHGCYCDPDEDICHCSRVFGGCVESWPPVNDSPWPDIESEVPPPF